MLRREKRSILVFASVAVSVCFTMWVILTENEQKVGSSKYYLPSNNIFKQKQKHYPVPRKNPKRILLWTSFYGQMAPYWGRSFYRIMKRECPVSFCEFVYDRRLIRTADAIIFHSIDLAHSYKFPKIRLPHQVWVFYTMQPVPEILSDHGKNITKLSGVFNWTMSYKRNSDIHVPFGCVEKLNKAKVEMGEIMVQHDYWAEKDKNHLIIWTVSSCYTYSNREGFVRDLRKFITVDQFGACNEQKCGKQLEFRQKYLGDEKDEICRSIIRTYMFYLALEDSLCNDYITEKVFVALDIGVVPVVFGKGNYSQLIPPDSYINALDFTSVYKLVEFLKLVARKKDLYNKFFFWKFSYRVDLGHPFNTHSCEICSRVHQLEKNWPKNGTKTIHSIENWLQVEKDVCYEYISFGDRQPGSSAIQPFSLDLDNI